MYVPTLCMSAHVLVALSVGMDISCGFTSGAWYMDSCARYKCVNVFLDAAMAVCVQQV